MAFVLFNISDEIVTREEAGIAYQEGNNRVVHPFSGKMEPQFHRKESREICREIQAEDQKKSWDLTYPWESVNG